MNVDYYSIARVGRLIALESLERRQLDLPGFIMPAVSLEPESSKLTSLLGVNSDAGLKPA
ncbi:MAG: hypothetical protein ABJI96_18960 [Paracoccaceae bacterium]